MFHVLRIIYTGLMNIQRVPSQAETSSAGREGSKSDDGVSLGFCCFPGELPRLGTAPLW